jgi:tRNA dimethylallyltransferase
LKNKTLIVVAGPTAIGKTAIAIELAKKLDTEIISCDSRQIYKELCIGVARPSFEELSTIKHHFIASQSISDYYNASMFELAVLDLLDELFKEHEVVVMSGGSGLYIDAVCKGIDDLPAIDTEIRRKILERFATEGIEPLRKELILVDPKYCKSADLANPKRIFKALEIFYMTGKPYSFFLTRSVKERSFKILKIALNRERKELYNNIDHRVDIMIQAGFENEAKGLYVFKHLNSLNTVGYKEIFDYLDGIYPRNEAINFIKQNTRRYAKRQITWFKRNNDYSWFHPDEKEAIFEFVNKYLKDNIG